MIQFFKKNLFLNSLMLLPYAALVRISSFLYPRSLPADVSYPELYKLLQLDHLAPLWQSILACFLLFLQANFINRLVTKHRIAKSGSLLAGMFYILFASFHSELLYLSPILVSMTFVILACSIIFQTYKKPNASIFIFNAAALLGIAALFYFPAVLYVLYSMVSFLILRSVKIRDIFQLILSFVLPFYLLYAGMYIYSGVIPDIEGDTIGRLSLSMFHLPTEIDHYILFGGMAIAILISLFSYSGYVSKKSIQSQKKIDLVYWLLLFSLLIFGFSDKEQFSPHLFAILPLAITIHMNVMNIRSKIVPEILHLLLVSVLLSLHFVL